MITSTSFCYCVWHKGNDVVIALLSSTTPLIVTSGGFIYRENMKTRVISTEIWDEDAVFSLNIDTKLLYLILLTNPYVGQTRFYKISDRQLSTFSGLNVEQIQKCKKDLSESGMAHFKDGWVCVTGYGFIECFYKGEKNEKAKEKEMEKIPHNILEYFNGVIGYQYPIDTTINHKSEILNHKSGIINQESGIIQDTLKLTNHVTGDDVPIPDSIQIGRIIQEFESINPACKKFYGNITQRKAVSDLLDTHGYERIVFLLREVLPKSNKIPFFPNITTPVQLRDKYATLENAIYKHKQSTNKEKYKII